MDLITADFKSIVEGLKRTLEESKEPGQTIGTTRADTKLLGQQYMEAKVGKFTLSADEPVPVGGTDRGPTPLEFFAASIGFCENITFTRNATLMGLKFEALETNVRGHWDRRGQYEIEGVSPEFKDMIVETRVTSNDSIQKIAEVTRLTHRRCPMPMHTTIVKAMKVTDKLFVNDKEVPL